MYRKISPKTYRLFYALILTLTVSMLAMAQIQERVVELKPQTIQKTPAAGHRISGIVTVNPDGQPVANTKIEIRGINRPAAGTQLFMSQTFTDEQGHWTINKALDDDYLIIVDPARTPPPVSNKGGQMNEVNYGVGTKFVSQTREVRMSGTDIDNLAIQVIKGGRITGKVVMDGGESLPKDLIVLPEQTVKNGRSPGRIAAVQSDGSFIIEGVPTGSIILKVVVYGRVKEYYTKTATVDGIDLLRETLSIEDGSEVKDVHIIFAKVMDK